MSRASSPYILGDYWLDYRSDGRAPGIWQIAFYNSIKRSITYTTTRERDLDRAKQAIQRHVHSLPVDAPPPTLDDAHIPDMMEAFGIVLPKPPHSNASVSRTVRSRPKSLGVTRSEHRARTIVRRNGTRVVPYIFRYWEEHGAKTASAKSLASYLRAFLGFIAQDVIGVECTFYDMDIATTKRFRDWSCQPHQFEVEWYGKVYRSSSNGIGPSSFNGRYAALKAALNHAVEEHQVPGLGRMMKPMTVIKQRARRVLTVEELGAMIGYARSDPPLLNWLLLMLGTGCRPGVAMKLVPSEQFDCRFGAHLNLHPNGAPKSKKRNPMIPVIAPLAELLSAHDGRWVFDYLPHQIMHRWNRLRDDLGFGSDVVSNTIRHTVATELEWRGASASDISELLGHSEKHDTMARYRLYRPCRMASVISPLTDFWHEVHIEADGWSERYFVTASRSGRKLVVGKSWFAIDATEKYQLRPVDSVAPRKLIAERSKVFRSKNGDGLTLVEMKAERTTVYFRVNNSQ